MHWKSFWVEFIFINQRQALQALFSTIHSVVNSFTLVPIHSLRVTAFHFAKLTEVLWLFVVWRWALDPCWANAFWQSMLQFTTTKHVQFRTCSLMGWVDENFFTDSVWSHSMSSVLLVKHSASPILEMKQLDVEVSTPANDFPICN